jgi:flavin-dependent dehydrogenase
LTTEFETHDHDVLIIGAGGAGLRAALGALAQGAKVGVVCKSLLGKAHTVMAEGGIAAAMANVDSADDWRTHFRDTMRGGKLLNNWRICTPRKLPSASENSNNGARFSIAPKMDKFSSALSAVIPSAGCATWAIAPAWR